MIELAPHTGIDADLEPATKTIKVLIADDAPLIIAGVRRTVERFDELEVVGEAATGQELLRLIERRQPDLVLMDLQMPGVESSEFIRQVRTSWPEVKVVVLSACDHRATIDAALAAGASAYVLKSAPAIDVVSVIRQASSGTVFHAPTGRPAAAGAVRDPHVPALTERERAILAAVASGLTTGAISRDLWVTEHTVKFHLTNIYRKLGVANRASAVRYALEHDLVAA